MTTVERAVTIDEDLDREVPHSSQRQITTRPPR
jgi:hypothetical protein